MKTKLWHRTLGALCFFPILLISIFLIDITVIDILICFLIYLSIAVTVSVGYHRLFTHNSFRCSRAFSYPMAFIGSATLNASPVQWASTHIAHHKYSDTDHDPYETSFKYFLRFRENRDIPLSKNAIRLYKDRYHRILHNYSFAIFLLIAASLLTISYSALILYFLLPTTAYLVTSGIHTIFAHNSHGPRNLKFLEMIIPMSGEWIHKNHHINSASPYFDSNFDFGTLIIKAIRNDKSTN